MSLAVRETDVLRPAREGVEAHPETGIYQTELHQQQLKDQHGRLQRRTVRVPTVSGYSLSYYLYPALPVGLIGLAGTPPPPPPPLPPPVVGLDAAGGVNVDRPAVGDGAL